MNKRQQTTPPPETLSQDWKTEGEVLATLLAGERVNYILDAGPELYTKPAYKELFSAAQKLREKGIAPEWCTIGASYPGVRDILKDFPTLEPLTDRQLDNAIAALSLLADERKRKAWAEKIIESPQDPDIAEKAAAALVEPANLIGYSALAEEDSAEQIIADIAKDKDGTQTGYILNIGEEGGNTTSLTIPPAALTLVCGLSGHCKSVFLRNLALSFAKDQELKGSILYFSYEETKRQTDLRLLNAYIGLDLNKGGNNLKALRDYATTGKTQFITGSLVGEFEKKRKEYLQLRESGRLRVYSPSYTTADLVREIKKFMRLKGKVAAIFIDYIQFLRSGKDLPRLADIQDTADQLLNLAKSTGLPVICAAQFNRQVRGPEDMTSNNIADSADLTRSASTIIGLWNSQKYADLDREKAEKREAYSCGKFEGFLDGSAGVVYLEVTKSRDIGAGPWAKLDFNGNTGVLTSDLPEGSAPKNSAQEEITADDLIVKKDKTK